MKKLFLLLTVCLAGLHAMAEMPVHFGIHGGVSSNRIKFAKSLSELKTQLLLCEELFPDKSSEAHALVGLAIEVDKMMNGLKKLEI